MTIQEFYPIGLDPTSPSLQSNFPGAQALDARIREGILGEFGQVWEQKGQDWGRQLGLPYHSAVQRVAPAYCGYFLLEQGETEDVLFEKRLYLALSLLGPFFVVFGRTVDRTSYPGPKQIYYGEFITPDRQEITRQAVISPIGEYQETFRALEKLVRTEHPQHRFVPFDVYAQWIDGLALHYTEGSTHTVYHALFNQEFDFQARAILGDIDYGSEDWKLTEPKP
ncbi:MAG TPA: hypothetical protein DCE41_01000 [Cytophagales bacterium]|nr:hypothetical protein [Cytophagales bacterium]HAA23480.1 hypothetical protein [Cytophagales bacterium]HAP58303.1 hypothetical protein [Cytophagales bacterium]